MQTPPRFPSVPKAAFGASVRRALTAARRLRALRSASSVAACALSIAGTLSPLVSFGQSAEHRVHTVGTGRPAIVLASGLGDTLESWQAVQRDIATGCGLTIAYNRAGYDGSPPPHGERDAAAIVSELRAELQRRGIAPPYVLVGHSLGGLYMQYFARRYPDDTMGLVLVDSTHWNQQLQMGAPTRQTTDERRTVLLFMDFIARRELAASATAGAQVNASPRAGKIPTIVLSSTGVFRGETPTSRVEGARLQEDIVADFPAARHIRVENSGHYIQNDRPDVVVGAVREVAGCTARKKRLAVSG